MDLRVTRAADPDRLLHYGSIEIPLVLLVMVPRPRNEVMTRQRLIPTANRAGTFHTFSYEQRHRSVVKSRHTGPTFGKSKMAAGIPAAI